MPQVTLYIDDETDAKARAAATAAGLRALDDRIQAILPLDDSIRRRWIKRASTYLRDACTGGRWIWLSEKESRALSHS